MTAQFSENLRYDGREMGMTTEPSLLSERNRQ